MNRATRMGFRDDNNTQRFRADTMERLITEARQLGVSTTFAHQCTRQLSARKADALSSVGATIVFRVNSDDTQYRRKNL